MHTPSLKFSGKVSPKTNKKQNNNKKNTPPAVCISIDIHLGLFNSNNVFKFGFIIYTATAL